MFFPQNYDVYVCNKSHLIICPHYAVLPSISRSADFACMLKHIAPGDDNLASWLPEDVSKHFEESLSEGALGKHVVNMNC